jgi:hypothetical protein
MGMPKPPKPKAPSQIAPFDFEQARRSSNQVTYNQDLEALRLSRQKGRSATVAGGSSMTPDEYETSKQNLETKIDADMSLQKDTWAEKKALEDLGYTKEKTQEWGNILDSEGLGSRRKGVAGLRKRMNLLAERKASFRSSLDS